MNRKRFCYWFCVNSRGRAQAEKDIEQKKSLRTFVRSDMAAGEGFEPSHTESESAVLPLHNPAKSKDYYTFFCRFVKSKFQGPAHFFDTAVSMLPPNTTKRSYRNSVRKLRCFKFLNQLQYTPPKPFGQGGIIYFYVMSCSIGPHHVEYK